MPNYSDAQIIDISEALSKTNVDYWFDSGTLLGLIRENNLIKNDKDIDIGTWSKNEEKVIMALESFSKDNYFVKKYHYKKRLFKIKLIPFNLDRYRKIDVCFFIEGNDSAWCFQSLFFKKRNKLIYNIRAIIEYGFTAKYIYRNDDLFYGKFPLNILRKPGFWKVPITFFKNTSTILYNNYHLRVPSDSERYLELRYGNWKIPKSDWNFMTDDGLLKREFPAEYLKNF